MFADGVLSGFEALEQKAVASLGNALREVQDSLYDATKDEGEMRVEEPEAATEYEQFRRFDANMYDAHTDIVEAKEIRQWQTAFPYICAVGIGYHSGLNSIDLDADAGEWVVSGAGVSENTSIPIPSPTPPATTQINTPYSRPRSHYLGNNGQMKGEEQGGAWHDNPGTDVDLMITGKKCQLHRCVAASDKSTEEGNEDVDIVSGILEEVIAIDCPGGGEDNPGAGITATTTKSNSNKCNTERSVYNLEIVPSPTTSRREEVISLLTDVVWADCVSVMRPLVEQVVQVSREQGIIYIEADVAGTTSAAAAGALNGDEEDGGFVSLDASGGGGGGKGRERASSFDSDW